MSTALAFAEPPASAAPRPRSRDLVVRRHGDEALHLLRPFWNGLVKASRADSMFLTWEWQESWWRHFGSVQGRDLQVLSFQTADERLVGLAPLYGERAMHNGIPLRTLRLLGDGSGDGDDLDLAILPGHEAAVCAALFRHLDESRGWDVLDLCPVPRESASLPVLERMAAASAWYRRSRRLACTYTPLPGDWDEYLGGLKSRLRSRVRSLLRRIVDHDDGRLERIDRPERLEEGLDVLFDLHTRRWQEIGQPGAFADPARRRFFREFAARALRNGWLRLYVLGYQGRPVAAQIGYVYGDTFLAVQEGFEPDAGSHSPGVALRAAVLRECVRDGLAAYDNLLGTPPQKMRWGAEERPVRGLTLSRGGTGGAAALRLIDAGREARNALRGWLRRDEP